MLKTRHWMFAIGFTITVTAAAPALACSQRYNEISVETPALAANNAIPMRVTGGTGFPEVTVSGADGAVSGTLESVRGLTVFRPDDVVPDGTYTITVTDLGDDSVVKQIEVGELPALDVEITVSPLINQASSGSVCCDNESDLCDGCGGCTTCWPAGYEYTRALDIAVTTNQSVVIEVEPLESGNGPMVASLGSAGLRLIGGDLDAEETCAVIRVLDFDGTEIHSETHCRDTDEFPESDFAQPDVPEKVAMCAEPPNDTEDPNWQRYGEKSSGCSTTAGSDVSLLGLLLVGLGMLRRRR